MASVIADGKEASIKIDEKSRIRVRRSGLLSKEVEVVITNAKIVVDGKEARVKALSGRIRIENTKVLFDNKKTAEGTIKELNMDVTELLKVNSNAALNFRDAKVKICIGEDPEVNIAGAGEIEEVKFEHGKGDPLRYDVMVGKMFRDLGKGIAEMDKRAREGIQRAEKDPSLNDKAREELLKQYKAAIDKLAKASEYLHKKLDLGEAFKLYGEAASTIVAAIIAEHWWRSRILFDGRDRDTIGKLQERGKEVFGKDFALSSAEALTALILADGVTRKQIKADLKTGWGPASTLEHFNEIGLGGAYVYFFTKMPGLKGRIDAAKAWEEARKAANSRMRIGDTELPWTYNEYANVLTDLLIIAALVPAGGLLYGEALREGAWLTKEGAWLGKWLASRGLQMTPEIAAIFTPAGLGLTADGIAATAAFLHALENGALGPLLRANGVTPEAVDKWPDSARKEIVRTIISSGEGTPYEAIWNSTFGSPLFMLMLHLIGPFLLAPIGMKLESAVTASVGTLPEGAAKKAYLGAAKALDSKLVAPEVEEWLKEAIIGHVLNQLGVSPDLAEFIPDGKAKAKGAARIIAHNVREFNSRRFKDVVSKESFSGRGESNIGMDTARL
jgi:hypothetical protein